MMDLSKVVRLHGRAVQLCFLKVPLLSCAEPAIFLALLTYPGRIFKR